MKKLFFYFLLILILIPCNLSVALDIDVDGNDAVDTTYGGTNKNTSSMSGMFIYYSGVPSLAGWEDLPDAGAAGTVNLSTYVHKLTLGTNGALRIGTATDYLEIVNDGSNTIIRPVGSLTQFQIGPITAATDSTVFRTGTTADDDAYVDVYDVDDTTYRHMMTFKAGNTVYGYIGDGTNGWRWDFTGLLSPVGTGDIDLANNSVDDADLNTTDNITFLINGGGAAIGTGVAGYIPIDFAATITQVTILADQSCSAVVDIWKDTYANYPPTDGDSITSAAPPTLTTALKNQDSTLTGWTTAITAGDILGFNVDSNDNAEILTITLKVTR